MKLEIKENENYSAQIVEIKEVHPLENADNIIGTSIMGNHVIVSKDTKVGDVGIFFPVEAKLSADYLRYNNLYRDKTLNADQAIAGFFELNGRIRCVKLRGHKSEGLFMPMCSLCYIEGLEDAFMFEPTVGISFDHVDNIQICEKYIIPRRNVGQSPKNQKKNKKIKKSRLIDNQFRFHIETAQLYRNLHKINYNDLISITYKLHGSSFIASNVLCKKKLNFIEKFLKKCKINVVDTEFYNLYSSRKVVKNSELLKKNSMSYYKEDIWKIANDEVKEFLQEGMTIYGEIVGYLSDNSMIQKEYDYGNKSGDHSIWIYRITYTNNSGHVFEWSMKQIQDFCKQYNLNAVPLLYYGYVKNFMEENGACWEEEYESDLSRERFLQLIKDKWLEKDCHMCLHKVPTEGVVIRKETNDIDVFKVKSEKFYLRETKLLDKNEENIEDLQ